MAFRVAWLRHLGREVQLPTQVSLCMTLSSPVIFTLTGYMLSFTAVWHSRTMQFASRHIAKSYMASLTASGERPVVTRIHVCAISGLANFGAVVSAHPLSPEDLPHGAGSGRIGGLATV